ncbi:acyltransferase [Flavobacterium sp.]|jgi:galactoside O-acetyltransferase|uniref:acyltransferase n=1 Tax=Flavobacterium sp. TaxID=239 RepID=UPI0037BED07D
MAFLSQEELIKIGFASIGENVHISDKASIYNPSKITIGSFVRIDDYCLLSAGEDGIEIGSYVHISCYACLIGQSKITVRDFVAISIKATILSSTSDFSGETLPLLNGVKLPGLDDDLFSVINKPVVLETHTGIGAHSIVFPGVTVGKGSAIGALSSVYEDVNEWGIYVGNPIRFLKKRSESAYNKMQEILKNIGG